MKKEIISSIRLTLAFLALFMVLYPSFLWTIAQLAPGKGLGDQIAVDGRNYYLNIGQSFTEDRYFNSRPSAAGYNAAGSCGSNKAASNPDYLTEVSARIDTFLANNPGVRREDIPSDLVTASGSGLDPHISPEAARIQILRIARVRALNPQDLNLLLEKHTQRALFNSIGPAYVNVLQLNLALDQLHHL